MKGYLKKIIRVAAALLAVAFLAFTLILPRLLGATEKRLDAVRQQRQMVVTLQREKMNADLAKEDFARLEKLPYEPDKFFEKDTTLVEVIHELETVAAEMAVTFNLSVSGTIVSAAKAKTTSELYVVPFTIRLNGEFNQLVAYLDLLENAATLVTVRSLVVSTAGDGQTGMELLGNFYLRK